MIARVDATPAAAALLEQLTAVHGPLMFHQSGGCCDGSSPMCFPEGEFRIGARDVFLGRIGTTDTPFFIGGDQFEYWQHTALTVDVVPGRGSGFSVEAPEGVRFITLSRVFSDQEATDLAAAGPPPRGPQAAGDVGADGSAPVPELGCGPDGPAPAAVPHARLGDEH